MAVYMIADTHFGHRNIVKLRPKFTTIEEHDASIMDNILSTVGKRDSLYILGDAFVGPTSHYQLAELVSRVEHLHVVMGNHCDERRGAPSAWTLASCCKSVTGMKRYKGAWLTHAPIHPDELRGKVNVHGHVHAAVLDDERYICVSCEAVDYTPINFASL